ncbi:MAG: IclR family transcriptional regulator [Alphaproteobacteria bacterium HGW-Alphaproteobacteria-5]|jgi:DNA-binding IclR family transcriptional regulator|nr:MAG: IclR family transcriptional regulator [Alphaproteobacteria bacterium HGW-Alphaproteobacteria-5]
MAKTASEATTAQRVCDSQRERTGTLVRGLSLLEAVSAGAAPMSLGELSAAADLDQSTTLRLLRTLEDEGYVVRNDATRRYSPSPKLLHPLPLRHPVQQLRRDCLRALTDVAQETGCTVILVLFMDMQRMVLEIGTTPDSLTPYYGPWLTGPLHATGVGKALLASLPSQRRGQLLRAAPLERFTDSTILDPEVLERQLDDMAVSGFVASREEYRPGVTNIAVKLQSWSDITVGCLNATGRAADLDDAGVVRVAAALKRAADLVVYQSPSLEAVARYCRH